MGKGYVTPEGLGRVKEKLGNKPWNKQGSTQANRLAIVCEQRTRNRGCKELTEDAKSKQSHGKELTEDATRVKRV